MKYISSTLITNYGNKLGKIESIKTSLDRECYRRIYGEDFTRIYNHIYPFPPSSSAVLRIKALVTCSQVQPRYQSQTQTSSTHVSKHPPNPNNHPILTATLCKLTSLPPAVVVPQQSSTSTHPHPALYASTNVPSTHWSVFTPVKSSVSLPSLFNVSHSGCDEFQSPLMRFFAQCRSEDCAWAFSGG